MARQMENQGERKQIHVRHIHNAKRKLTPSQSERTTATTTQQRKIPRDAPRTKNDEGKTHNNKKKRAQHQTP